MTTRVFRSNGKLMISGEYLVLAGAAALAMPVRYGQTLSVTESPAPGPTVLWRSLENGVEWFRADFMGATLSCSGASDPHICSVLRKILLEAKKMNPAFLRDPACFEVRTELEFDRGWGLGSSSTLVSNIAWWAGVDPYPLLFNTLGGSGYDIACARSHTPLMYHYQGREAAPRIHPVDFQPPFSENLYFVYTGRKQSSAGSLQGFFAGTVKKEDVERISALSFEMLQCNSLQKFMELLEEHEQLTGRVIGQRPVQGQRFLDFNGIVKSLGAWGGDFLLAASALERKDVVAYFRRMGTELVIPFNEMIPKSV